MTRPTLAFAALLFLATPLAADNWPQWRGPTGQGFCAEKDLPLTWSQNENVKWKIDLEMQGNSTPVVWGERIFLTQATTEGKVRSLLCFARDDGRKLWQRDVPYDKPERNWNKNWYANASPLTDGERVVVTFGSAGMVCYNFAGEELWKRTDLGEWQHAFGNGASPVFYGDLVIQWCGPNEKGRNFLLAAKKATGETVWEYDEKNGSWGTPIVVNHGDRDQLLLSTVPHLKSFDPKTGDVLWYCEGLNKYAYASPLFSAEHGIAVAMSGYNGAALAVKVGGEGDITASRLWDHPNNIQRVGSGMIIGDHCYLVEENGVPHCYELQTGKQVWELDKRPSGGTTWGSMVHAEGRLYVLMRSGKTLVFAAQPQYELLATNDIGPAETNSSLAISNGDVFLRTFKHLWCIGKPAP